MRSVRTARQPERQDALERRLFDATEQLIGEGASFAEISVERLAARAGISRSTFYVHFQDKGELARKLAATVLTQLGEMAQRWWHGAEHADRAALREAITAIVDVYRRHAAAAVLIWMVERAGYQLVRGADPANDPAIIEVLTDIVWTTLYPTPT